MSEELRTKLDFVYAEVLGEVGGLVDRLEAAGRQVDAVVTRVEHDLDRTSRGLEGARKSIVEHIANVVTKEAGRAQAQVRADLEQEKDRVMAEIRDTMASTVAAALDAQIGLAVTDARKAASALAMAAQKARSDVAGAARDAQPRWTKLLLGVAMASALGGGVAAIAVSHLVR